MSTPIIAIAEHNTVHQDEKFAEYLLREYGTTKYPGIDTANIVIWDEGSAPPDGLTADQWEKQGVLAVGVGRGRLDDHSLSDNDSESAASLVAKDLGIFDNPEVKGMIEYVTKIDLTGGNQLGQSEYELRGMAKKAKDAETRRVLTCAADTVAQAKIDAGDSAWALPKLISDGHLVLTTEEVDTLANLGFKVRHLCQKRYLEARDTLYDQVASEVMIPRGNGQSVKVVTIKSDNPFVARNAFSRRPGLVIIQTSNGNVQILNYAGLKARLDELVAMIRVEEQRARGVTLTTDFKELRQEGEVPGAECWHYTGNDKDRRILNGSLSYPNADPTQIPLERIQELVAIFLNEKHFDPDRKNDCQKGLCISSRQHTCPMFNWGMWRCYSNQKRQRQARVATSRRQVS